jgi:hypothetical protein
VVQYFIVRRHQIISNGRSSADRDYGRKEMLRNLTIIPARADERLQPTLLINRQYGAPFFKDEAHERGETAPPS